MTKIRRQFDRNKYLNSPHALTPEQVARMELARERALQMRPSEFWLRAAASLAITLLICGAVGWLADWSMLQTGIWIGALTLAWMAAFFLARRRYTKGRRRSP